MPAHLRRDFSDGLRPGGIIGLTFFFIFFGFAVVADRHGLSGGEILLFSATSFSAPAQYAVIDALSASPGAWQLILIGVATNLRFFVMSLGMSHFTRDEPLPSVLRWAFFLTASPFMVTLFHKRKDHRASFLAFFKGVITASYPFVLIGTAAGLLGRGELPPVVMDTAPFVFPVYFAMLLAKDVKRRAEIFTVAASFIAAPLLEQRLPGWGVVAAAFIGATLALGIRAWKQRTV